MGHTNVRVTDEQRARFDADGAVLIPKAIDPSWIDPLLAVAERELAEPSRWVTDSNPGQATDRLFTTRYLWPTDETIRSFALSSGIGAIVADLLGSASARLYFDHTLVKEPGTTAPTPWHQDIPYWPFLGRQIASAWVALTPATVNESSLEFVRGSHRWDAYYAPESFTDSSIEWASDFEGERVPDIDTARCDYDIIGFDVEPGDAIVFSSWILHGAPGNSGDRRRVAVSTRWLGDDAVWSPHPGSDPTVTQADVSVEPGHYPADDRRFPLAKMS